MKKYVFLGLFGLMSSSALANQPYNDFQLSKGDREIGLSINNEDLELFGNSEWTNNSLTGSKYVLDGRFLKSEKYNSYEIGGSVMNVIEPLQGSEFSVGLKYVGVDVKNDDYYQALPIMVKFKYYFPELMYKIPPVSINGELLYAPNVLGLSDVTKYSNIKIEGNIEPIQNVNLFVGYRDTNLDSTSGKLVDEDAVYGGLKFNF